MDLPTENTMTSVNDTGNTTPEFKAASESDLPIEEDVQPDDSAEKDAEATEQPGDQSGGTTSGVKLAIIIVGLCFSVFCVALDNTIIATAIPRITDEFHALQDVGWYGSGEENERICHILVQKLIEE